MQTLDLHRLFATNCSEMEIKMAERKVKIIADSTCDLSKEQLEKYGISIIPLCIVLDEKSYYDMEEISPDEIYQWADANKKTPKTAAISVEYAENILKSLKEENTDLIFIGISEKFSTTCNVMRLVAQMLEMDGVFVVDSSNLSTGIGLQVIRAARLAKEGMVAEDIVKEIEASRSKVRASFVVDSLTYLARGGRCSGAMALAASALKLHPCIQVIDGQMEVGAKYRGSLSKAMKAYVAEMRKELLEADKELVFITHSGIDEEIIRQVREELEAMNCFKEIAVTRAGGVISSHCGPGTLGVLYYME